MDDRIELADSGARAVIDGYRGIAAAENAIKAAARAIDGREERRFSEGRRVIGDYDSGPCWTIADGGVRIERRLAGDDGLDVWRAGGECFDEWIVAISGRIDDAALSRAAAAAREFRNADSEELRRLSPPRQYVKNFHGHPVRFEIEKTDVGHRAYCYGFIGCTEAELGMRRASGAFNSGVIPVRFGGDDEGDSPQGFVVESVHGEGEVRTLRRLIGPDAWRIEIEGAISWRSAQRACDYAAYHANPNAMGPRLPPKPREVPIRQCDCGISGRGWVCPTCKPDEYYS